MRFESGGSGFGVSLAGENVGVIEPERGHRSLQLTRALDGTEHPRFDRLAQNDALLDARIFGRVFYRALVAVFRLRYSSRLHDRALILDEQSDRGHVQRAMRADALD